MDISKFEKCIRLTASTNDHEALAALRAAQNMCNKNKIDFTDFVLKHKPSQNSSSSKEVEYLRAQLNRVVQEKEELDQQYYELYLENTKLKKKLETNKGSKSLRKKHKELQEEHEWIEEENDLLNKELGIFHHVYDCVESEKNEALAELVEEFIKNKNIKVSNKDWISTLELFEKFKSHPCHDVYVMSVKKFSQIFSSRLQIKPVKGGPKKDRMGFHVRISYY